MNHDSATFDSVASLLRDTQATERDVVTAETRLRQDLRMDGDDAVAFLDQVARRWDVNFDGFEFGRFFLGEAEISSPVSWLVRRVSPNKRRKTPITVGHLVSVIDTGRWQNPDEAAV